MKLTGSWETIIGDNDTYGEPYPSCFHEQGMTTSKKCISRSMKTMVDSTVRSRNSKVLVYARSSFLTDNGHHGESNFETRDIASEGL